MKKLVAALLVTGLFSFSFACSYSEKTHELKECKAYKNSGKTEEVKESCKEAHREYNKYVAKTLGKKTVNVAGRVGNSISKFVGGLMEETANDAKKAENAE